jgi:protein phosphatase 2C
VQVANYCRERIHLALAEEIGVTKDNLNNGRMEANLELQWEKAFTSCFHKVDDEIGGNVGRSDNGSNGDASEPVAPETVGSTAVVALICSSHIIVANCGDSRAVLCRGKEAMALSIDHKVGHVFLFGYLYTFMESSLPWKLILFHTFILFFPAEQRR